MKKFSKKEHLLVFRKKFEGPIHFSKGDQFWSKVSSMVNNGTEYFTLLLDESHPDYKKIAKEFSDIYLEDWDGTFNIPCNYLQFADQEVEDSQREIRNAQLKQWKEANHG
jgi:hypothetical protein